MNRLAFLFIFGVTISTIGARDSTTSDGAGAVAGRGAIRGHVRLNGKPRANPVIRMGMDPMCARINAGKRIVQDIVSARADGSLANAFANVVGPFPHTSVPSAPVVVDQRGCTYTPRVIGARVGQTIQVRNDDELMHNVHSMSVRRNGFNVSEPRAGMVQQFVLKDEELMLRLRCDVHSWMTAYVGVVDHPYFAVSDSAGVFDISNVPAGSHRVQIWHEQYGVLTRTVQVKSGETAPVEFTFDAPNDR